MGEYRIGKAPKISPFLMIAIRCNTSVVCSVEQFAHIVLELSPNNRATCKDTECKKNGEKVTKGTLRFGSYVVINEHGGWTWKHWGCVSGQQLENVRELCQQGDGSFDCDLIDGYDELVEHPDVQEKVRRCINQGFIDPEDFKGDPEKNKLGEKGIHLTEAQKKKKKAAAEAAATGDEEKPKAKGKRGRKKAADDEEDEDEPQPKKARTSKTAKADEEEKPAAKPTRGRKAAKVKDESEDETAASAPAPAPAKRGRRASAQKAKDESDAEEKPVPIKKGRKAATKKAKNESDDEVPAPAPAPAKQGRKAATKKAATPEEEDVAVEEEEQEKTVPRTRARRGRSGKA
ncbi:hypothetical protein ACKAV7_009297 [Fusarium commune]|uniref:PARP-type zinc finger-containing protein n=1 Tax=Fusarium oxysporum f. sp. rapae TaxID=485398 RepID=A0A8J5P6Q3_FUSOX|nr:PARP-type zinc finger-containing protein [Fusarium oxysporum f. sp. rapae]